MRRRKFAAILVHFYISWLCMELIDRALGVTICENSFERGSDIITLNVSLSSLNTYNGNCSCILRAVNVAKNVTLTSDVNTCGSISLDVSHWCYTADCSGTTFTEAVQVEVGDSVNIFLDVSENNVDFIPGSLRFTSDHGSISIRCDDAIYDIPPTTTTPTTTTPTTTTPTTTVRTTTPELPVAETISAAAAIVFFGFVILMLPIALCIRYRERKKRKHDAEMANLKQVIPDLEREKVDPEMLKYSWFKSLTIRLRKYYYGEGRQHKSGHGRGARGRSLARNTAPDPTGTHARKNFQRLFRKKSQSTNSSSTTRDHSPIEDDDPNSQANEATEKDETEKEEVFSEVPAQHGGGVFMDARRSSLDTLDQAPNPQDEQHVDTDTAVTVHSEDGVTTETGRDKQNESGTTAEEDYVSSLFGDFDDKAEPQQPHTSSEIDEEETREDGHYADIEPELDVPQTEVIDTHEHEDSHEGDVHLQPDEHSEIPQTSGDNGVIEDSHYASVEPVGEEVHGDKDVADPVEGLTEQEPHNPGDSFNSHNSDVIPNDQTGSPDHEDDVSHVSKVSNGHPPDKVDDIYASVNKSTKKGALFRI